jgi:peptidoglycan hydrolase-like protein with peptidoglycan-binding domain
MNTKVGSPVATCSADTFKPGKPADPKDHKNCAIRILSIKEPGGDEYKDCAVDIHVKSLNDPLQITYEVKTCTMKVTLWVEYDSGNKVHSKFYKPYDGKGVIGKRVAILLQCKTKAPGIYKVKWDGRDNTKDRRILLDGTYTVRIQGIHAVTKEDKTTIKFQIPFSCNYGIHYHKSKYDLHSTKKEIEYASDKQKKLKDGTGFDASSSVTEPALFAWGIMQVSAVIVAELHSNPFLMAFHSEESKPGKRAYYRKSKKSVISSFDPGKTIDADNSVVLPNQSADALRDVFLMIMSGCRTGNEVLAVQGRLKSLSKKFNPGPIDGKHGPKTTAALKAWQQWEKIRPDNGEKNPATLAALKVDPTLDEKRQTREVQKKLKSFSKRYNPGKEDGIWGDKTETALTNYQQDHCPPLDINSLPDKKTLKHLKIDGSKGAVERSLVDAFIRKGCNIVFGFRKKVSFAGAEKWLMNFWKQAAGGSGIDDAASEAKTMCGRRYAKELVYNLKTRDGVDKNATLHPARHGRDM